MIATVLAVGLVVLAALAVALILAIKKWGRSLGNGGTVAPERWWR